MLSDPFVLLCIAISGLEMANLISHSAVGLGLQMRRYQLWQLADEAPHTLGDEQNRHYPLGKEQEGKGCIAN